MEKEKEELFDEKDFTEEEEPFAGEKTALEKAFFAFAEAAGKKPEEIEEILRKGMEFDEISRKYGKAKEDSGIFEKLAEIRGISGEEMRNEILWALEKAVTEKAVFEIMEENPGMNRETARELALYRRNAEKPEKKEPENKIAEKLRELDEFIERHSDENIRFLDNSVIGEWEKGIPLETAFEKYTAVLKNSELSAEIEKMKKEQIRKGQGDYAREHSPGSAAAFMKKEAADDFVAELFKEY